MVNVSPYAYGAGRTANRMGLAITFLSLFRYKNQQHTVITKQCVMQLQAFRSPAWEYFPLLRACMVSKEEPYLFIHAYNPPGGS